MRDGSFPTGHPPWIVVIVILVAVFLYASGWFDKKGK